MVLYYYIWIEIPTTDITDQQLYWPTQNNTLYVTLSHLNLHSTWQWKMFWMLCILLSQHGTNIFDTWRKKKSIRVRSSYRSNGRQEILVIIQESSWTDMVNRTLKCNWLLEYSKKSIDLVTRISTGHGRLQETFAFYRCGDEDSMQQM